MVFFYKVNKNEFYFPGRLILFQEELDENIEWILWAKTSYDSFMEMTELFTTESEESHLFAQLLSPIFPYDNTNDLKVKMVFFLKEKVNIPKIEILKSHLELYEDFNKGMSKNKYLEIQRKFNQ